MQAALLQRATKTTAKSWPEMGSARVRSAGAEDIEQHTEQLLDWALRYDQLDCGRFRGHFTDVRWPGIQLFMERTTRRVRQRGHLQPDTFAVGLLVKGCGSMSANGVHSGVGSILAGDAVELDVCTPADCTLVGLVVESNALREAASRMNAPQLLADGSPLLMSPPAPVVAAWRDSLMSTLCEATQEPSRVQCGSFQKRASAALLSGLVELMGAADGDACIPPADHRKRIVDRACDLLLARPDDPPSLFEVCTQVGASPRKLGYCFQDVLGVSPVRYIKAIRLNGVRRELARAVDPALSVYDVAARWGFWHFGHFSGDYKRQFLELPSETLRRARQ